MRLKIRFSLFCEGVVKEPGEKTATWVMNPLGAVQMPFIPSLFTMSLLAGIDDLDPDKPGRIIILIRDPSGRQITQTLFDLRAGLTSGPEIVVRPDGKANGLLYFEFKNFVVEQTGVYVAELRYGSQLLSSAEVQFVRGKEDPLNGSGKPDETHS